MSDPVQTPPGRMTVEAFLTWTQAQPRGHFELLNGEVVTMAPQVGAHLRTRKAVDRALDDAVAQSGLDCEALPEGAAVVVDAGTAFEPDALINCGERMGDRAVIAPNPVVVVEVVSEGSRRLDTGIRLTGYLRVPSIRHYLILWPSKRIVVHHRRAEDGRIASTFLGNGTLLLDPPGLSLEVEGLFPPAAD